MARDPSRRMILQQLGASAIVTPLAYTLGCSGDDAGSGTRGGTEGTEGTATSGATDTTGESSGGLTESSSDSSSGELCGGAAEDWAAGGTAAMTDKDCYPDPFAAGLAGCALLCRTTAGPCTAETTVRQDVSEGWPGLPVRLALKIVRAETCEAVEDAAVEIWHTQRTGVYSGETPAGDFCYVDDPEAVNYLYFRGVQISDAEGRVDFDTCFPGWYPNRAIHIHFRVYLGGVAYLTSQLFFDDALTQEIFASHPDYSEFGQPDTSNSDDGVVSGVDDLAPYLLEVQRMPDGAMLASKVIAIRSSADVELCSTSASP